MDSHPIIHLDGVRRVFAAESPVVALSDVHLTVAAGEYIAIMGRSGSGKSTLLNVLGLLDSYDEGTYLFDGQDVASLSGREVDLLRSRAVGFVFQAFHLVSYLTVAENVALGLTYSSGSGGTSVGQRVTDLLDRVGLSHRRTAMPATLSGGERQRVAIARALVHEPSVLLADEPTGNLDEATAESVLDLFEEFNRDGVAILLVTHDPDTSRRAGRTVAIRGGEVIESPTRLPASGLGPTGLI